jgi:hypothetical protein
MINLFCHSFWACKTPHTIPGIRIDDPVGLQKQFLQYNVLPLYEILPQDTL